MCVQSAIFTRKLGPASLLTFWLNVEGVEEELHDIVMLLKFRVLVFLLIKMSYFFCF